MKRQGGFTLIELVVVIVILGILAVTAAPRFLNLQDDARSASIQGLKGAIAGAAGITYGKAAIDGQDGASGAISVGTSTLNLVNGYPEATSTALSLVVEGLDEWELKGTPTATTIRYGITGYTTECVQYVEAADSENGANITVFTPAANGTECND